MSSRPLAILVLFLTSPVYAASIFVDPTLGSECNNYDVATRSCGDGSNLAFASVDSALRRVAPGDTIFLRGGNYGQISIQNSGMPGSPIKISSFDNENATVTAAGSIGLSVIGQTDIVFENLIVSDVVGFGRIENSTRIVFSNMDFSNATSSGTTGSLKFVRSSRNAVKNSRFRNGSDLLILQDNSRENVIQGNDFSQASHSLISIRCSGRNVMRENVFDNPNQKALEIYDCEGISDAPVRLNDTRNNLLERNLFLGTRSSSRRHDYNAIQHGAQQTIVRFNVFARNLGGGVYYQYYADESLYVYGNRLYNNTFYDNRCFAISGANGNPDTYYDNLVVNNLLYLNTDCSGGGQQVDIDNSNAVALVNNAIVTTDPGFNDVAAGDYSLRPGSDGIDAGRFVARATSAGSGSVLPVDDTNWFFDGFGIPGELGDTIQVEGQTEVAQILTVSFANKTLTLDRPISWPENAGIHLTYSGSAPDIGAFEFGMTQGRPNPPTDLE